MTKPPPLPHLPPRPPDSHKGDFGRALLVGGSRGMSGAIGLAGMAALRGGAGLVTLAVPDAILGTVAAYEPSYMTTPLACDAEGLLSVAARERIAELASAASCLGCGPGLGRSHQIIDLIAWMYAVLPQPIVIDADGLFALAEYQEGLTEPGGPRIWTPHPGELRRFIGAQPMTREQMEQRACELAATSHAVIVLKGHRTFITDGVHSYWNTTGNPGMATGGCGDVLTGLVVALVCQGLAPLDAARLGVHIHGLAGDLAAAELGEVAMIASDLIRFLPHAIRRVS
ncbi:MAG: NAD(P)H-hydrate dehydratase [Pirellulaceae bacterium]